MKALVVGAGVMGLSSAIRLAEQGRDVHIISKERPFETTSAAAAAFLEPYLAEPQDKIRTWFQASFREFDEIGATKGSSVGVERRMLYGLGRTDQAPPAWSDVVPNFSMLTRKQICDALGDHMPVEFQHGYSFETWMVEMPKYLPYLRSRFRDLGGTIEYAEVKNLTDELENDDIVVNCSGLGSRELVPDPTMYPVGGQVVQVERRAGEDSVVFDTDGVTYVVARGTNLILGGTAVKGLEDRTPVDATSADIIERCERLVPGLKGRDIQLQKVGLRPGRPEIRLDREGRIIHNYGHGGSGVTLSWGCADEVTKLSKQLIL